jgi:hypothetical protein
MRFLTSGFFHGLVSTSPLSIPLGPFKIFLKICEIFMKECLSTVVSDTGDKLCTSVNDTGIKFIVGVPDINPCYGFSVIAGVNDTGDKFIAHFRWHR